MKTQIAIEVDTDRLGNLSDERLATLWHVAQANPASIDDAAAGDIVEAVGREIICRWLKGVRPELWRHQGKHHYWGILQKHGKWLPVVDGDENGRREWKPSTDTEPGCE